MLLGGHTSIIYSQPHQLKLMLVKNVEFFSGKTAEAPSMGLAARATGVFEAKLLRMSDNPSCLWEEVLAEGISWVRSGALVLRAAAESGAGVRGTQNYR